MKTINSHRLLLSTIAINAMCLLLGACSTLTLKNYDHLKLGMSYDEITHIIGKADNCSEKLGTRLCRWGDDAQFIKVTFIANHATFFTNKGIQ